MSHRKLQLEKIGKNWKKLENIGKNWKKLEKIGKTVFRIRIRIIVY